uniref:Uncharacterized protein n=1 Tax=Anguilla anguilla TaxID=7936 RepID=A0A0E9SN26_ANGAN
MQIEGFQHLSLAYCHIIF